MRRTTRERSSTLTRDPLAGGGPGYRFSNLSAALRDRRSPLRRYLDARYPAVRAVQTEFRQRCGHLDVGGGDADPATLGAAFDFAVRFVLVPDHVPTVAVQGFGNDLRAVAVVEAIAREAASGASVAMGDRTGASVAMGVRTGASVAMGVRTGASVATGGGSSDAGLEQLGRACWALALCTDVYRRGLTPGSTVARLLAADRFTCATMLAAAPRDGLRQLAAMHRLAAERLLPQLHPPYHLGPTFDGSALCKADADLICDGLLIDVKTHLGAKNPRTGARSAALSRVDLYQLISYALFDRRDRYAITRVGIYNARYGALVAWPLGRLLCTLATDPELDVARERERMWSVLAGG